MRVVSPAEERLARALERLATLTAEHDALAADLGDFEEREERELRPAREALFAAERVTRRLDQLAAELGVPRALIAPRPARRPPRHHDALRDAPFAPRPAATAEPSATLDLRSLYRRLARALHPDAARGEADRARRSALMLRLNAAYEDEDRVRLELLAAEVEGLDGEGPGARGPDDDEARLEARHAAVAPLIDDLERDLRRLRTSAAARRLEEARRAAEAGRDHFDDQKSELRAAVRRHHAAFDERAARVEEAVRAFNGRLGELRSAAGPRETLLDPPLPFRDAVTAMDARGAPGTALDALARDATWKAAWVMAAVFAEVAGTPPEALATFAAWGRWHEEWRRAHRGTPTFAEALTALPRTLELGCRVHADGLRFGIGVRAPDPALFSPDALGAGPCAAIAAELLLSIAARATCRGCGRGVPVVHVHLLREVDPLHAFVCSRCGAVVEQYRAVGRAVGFEALAPYAEAAGLVEAVPVTFGGAVLHLEVLRRARQALTAKALCARFREVAIEGLVRPSPARGLMLHADGVALGGDARVPRGAALALSFSGRSATTEQHVLERLQERHSRRFEQRGQPTR